MGTTFSVTWRRARVRRGGIVRKWFARSGVTGAIALILTATGAAAQPYQGFGANTPGGAGQPIVHVTNLHDAGPGSLREALAAGHRTIVFDVAGEILLQDHLYVLGAFITVDGFTAPSPGITLRGYGPIIRGTSGAHDIIIRGIRVRDAVIDGFQVASGASNVVLDHLSVAGSADGNIDITESHDVTVSWSIVGANGKNMLIKYRPSRVTLHHNLLASNRRNPQVQIEDSETPTETATETTLDMRNNVVASWVGHGTLIWNGPRANVVGNAYQKTADAIGVIEASVYVAGNLTYDGVPVGQGTAGDPSAAPAVDVQPALLAKHAVMAGAGARPLDATDLAIIAAAGGADLPPPLSGIDLMIKNVSLLAGAVAAGESARIRYSVANQGTQGVSHPDRYAERFYLSADTVLGDGDVLLKTGVERKHTLAPSQTRNYSQSLIIPETTAAGHYFILVEADALDTLAEADEENNVAAIGVTVTSE